MNIEKQGWLDEIARNDIHGFLKVEGNWDNHRPMLLLALHLAAEKGVLELGAGDGSTPYLRSFCKKKHVLMSFDSNKEWAEKCGSGYVYDWNTEQKEWAHDCGVAFIDLAPGEYRKTAIEIMADKADIIVVHDSEEGGAGNYQLDKIWHFFKYRLNYNKTGGGAGATALSNTIDLHQFAGCKLGCFEFEL